MLEISYYLLSTRNNGVVRVHFAEIGSDVSPGMPVMLGRYRDIDSRNERFRISAFQNISNF